MYSNLNLLGIEDVIKQIRGENWYSKNQNLSQKNGFSFIYSSTEN